MLPGSIVLAFSRYTCASRNEVAFQPAVEPGNADDKCLVLERSDGTHLLEVELSICRRDPHKYGALGCSRMAERAGI